MNGGLSKAHHALRVLVDHITYGNRWGDFEEVGSKAFIESTRTLGLEGFAGDITDAGVGSRMEDGALSLHSGSKDVQRVDNGSAEASTEGTDSTGGEVVERHVVFVTLLDASLAGKESTLQIFECGQIDRGIRKHSNKAQGESTEKSE